MDNVVNFAAAEKPTLLVGPFETWKVIVGGRVIPRLSGKREGDQIWLTVDDRFTARFSEEGAYNAAYLLAEALAIGEGYPHSGAENKDKPFAPIGMEFPESI